ncbi:MAG: RimK family alpha-L-glutamate ligase, partial [Anaerolineales bacterium]
MIISRLRLEEKLIMKAFKQRGASAVVINDSDVVLNPLELDPSWLEYDLVLQRSLSSSRAISTLQVLEAWGVPTLNNYQTVLTCSDKLRTTLALARAGVPQVEMRISFSQEASQRAIEEIGYPAVLKPLVGSWGRLVAKINDPESAEALLEHRFTLGNYPYHTSYVQSYVEKPQGRDIRAAVVGDRPIYAIYRTSSHWITNTARGGVSTNFPVTTELEDICRRAAAAVGGGIVAIDLFETGEGLVVNEV